MRPELSDLTADFLRHLLHYDPLTGVWTWVNPLPRSKVRAGDRAGRINCDGRRQIGIGGRVYYSSCLAYLYMTGEWPEEQIDHDNLIRSDDRWENLRPATQSQNSFNRDWANMRGSLRGIYKHGNKFRVDVGCIYYGLFSTLDEAVAVRNNALRDQAGPFAVLEMKRA